MVLLLLYALLITSTTKCCGIHQIKSEVLSLTRNIFKKKCTYLEIRSSEKPPFFIIVKQMPCDFFFFFKKERKNMATGSFRSQSGFLLKPKKGLPRKE